MPQIFNTDQTVKGTAQLFARKNSMIAMMLLFLCLLLMAGCSQLNGTRLEPVMGGEVNLVDLGDKVVEHLVAQPMPPLIQYQADQPVLITTLVNNDKLNETTTFGRTFQNHLVAAFAQRGYAVKEIKLRRDLLVELNKGEFMLTRNLAEMMPVQHAQAVVVGTYTLVNRILYLSVRMVAPSNQAIRGVYEDKVYLDDGTLRLFGYKYAENPDPDTEIVPPKPSVLDSILY